MDNPTMKREVASIRGFEAHEVWLEDDERTGLTFAGDPAHGYLIVPPTDERYSIAESLADGYSLRFQDGSIGLEEDVQYGSFAEQADAVAVA